ncbi:MAG: CoA transferase [Desulfobacteraceae bacterium]|nr:CoA transferase [Desulfobacteraceae bacterium]
MKKYYPLEGVRVLGLEQYIAGPDCTMWLADQGAEVIKIERPGSGDPRRNYLPAVEDNSGNKAYGGFEVFNRNKKSLTLNIQSEKGKEIFKEIVKHADVVVENMAPGTVEKLGLGYDTLRDINPRLIYAAISGFGRLDELKGPYSKWPAFDPVIQAMAGIMDQIGEADGPPLWGFPGLADLFTGVVTGYAILLALFMRERTGEGQFIDSSMYDSLAALNEMGIMNYSFGGGVVSRGAVLKFQAPAGAYKVKDGGYISFLAANDFIWKRFCKAIDREDLVENPKTATGPERVKNKDFLEPIVEEWMGARTRKEVVETLLKSGVPIGPVQNTEDLINCPQLKAREMLIEIEHPVAGKRVYARSPIRMTKAEEVPTNPSPRLGEHTESILKDLLKYDEHKIEELHKEEII